MARASASEPAGDGVRGRSPRVMALSRVVVVALVAAAVGCSAGSTEGYCEAATTMGTDNPAWVFGAWDPAAGTDGADLRHAARQLHRLAEVAPAEIETEVGLIANTADELAELLTELSGDDLTRAMQDRVEDFDQVDDASRRSPTSP